jgi:hypothetical protein
VEPVIWMIVAGVVLVGGAIAQWLRARRREDMASVALRNGLSYSETHPFDCTRIAFPLFRMGDDRGAENVMWRDGDRGPVRGFDYWCKHEHRDASGQSTPTFQHFTCVLAFVNGGWPDLSIRRDGFVAKITDAIDGADIDFESDEFNRMFSVRCADRRFATALIDPQMMEVLLTTGGRLAFDLKGRWMLVHCDRTKASFVPAIMRVAETLIARIPRVVWELYPTPFIDESGAPLPAGDEDAALQRLLRSSDSVVDPLEAGRTGMFGPIYKALEDDGVDYDLDGKPLPTRTEDPWGAGNADE